MSTYTLVGTPFSTFTRSIALGLHYKSVPFQQTANKPHEPIADKHHPFGFLPTLVIHTPGASDVYLRESQAIARYIDRIAPEPSLQDPQAAIPEKMWEFVSLCGAYGFPRFEVGVIKVRMGKSGATESDILSALEPGLEQLRAFIAALESLIAADGFAFVKDTPTWADFFLYPLVADLEATPESHVLPPRLVAWSKLMKTVGAVKATEKGTLADEQGKL